MKTRARQCCNDKQILRYAQDDVILSKRSEAKNLLFFSRREEVRR